MFLASGNTLPGSNFNFIIPEEDRIERMVNNLIGCHCGAVFNKYTPSYFCILKTFLKKKKVF